jgi:hypothetical protein
LRIAAGNVPNFVDLETGGWGGAIQDPLNSSQTPTMANFATLADLLSACVTRVKADACSSLFEAARPPSGGLPTDTLNTSESIALFPWYQPEKLFALLRQFYPLQMQTDLGIDPAGNVWVMNNWQDIDSCIGAPKEALSTRCGGQGVTIFYGMAKPVRAPQIGPAKPY